MLKFDLARRYVVGILILAMIFGAFLAPPLRVAKAQQEVGTVTLTLLTTNPHNTTVTGSHSTAVLQALVQDAGGLRVQSATVYFRIQTDMTAGYLLTTPTHYNVTDITGTCTYGFTWDDLLANTSITPTPGVTYYARAWWDYNGNGVWDTGSEPISQQEVAVVFVNPELATLEVINTPTLNKLGTDTTHTITVNLYDQFGDPITGDITIAVSPTQFANPYEGVETSTTATVFTYTTSRTTDGTDTIVVTTSTGDVTLTETVYKTWYVPVLTTLTVTPMYAANDWGDGTSHTLTANMYDQYGQPITGTIMWSVSPTIFANPYSETATGISGDTFTYTTSRNVNGDEGTDIITVTGIVGNQTLTVTASKDWYYTPQITTVVVTPTEAKNRIDPLNPQPVTHTITIEVKDQYDNGYTGNVTALITVSGVNSITDTVPFTGPSTTWTYTSTNVGTDTITVTIGNLEPKTVTKLWGYTETLVAPDYVDLNTTFTVTVYGAPGDALTLYWWMNPYVGDLPIIIEPTVVDSCGCAVYTFKSPSFATVLDLLIGVHDSLEGNTVWLDKKITVQQGGAPPEPPGPGPETVYLTLNLKQGWNMVTPGLAPVGTPASIFGSGFVSIFRWDPITGMYQVPSSLEPGKGYWVKMSADKVVTLEGSPTDSPFTLAVSSGWNQIGNPFETDIPWTHAVATLGSQTKTLSDAKAAGWIGSAFSWNPVTGLYEPVNYATGTMYAGKGYWIRVYAPVTLTFTK